MAGFLSNRLSMRAGCARRIGMWDKLVSRERERQLGILFGCVLVASCIYGILAEHFPLAAQIVAAIFGGALLVVIIRAIAAYARGRRGRIPTGPLSWDERNKARAKLRSQPPPFGPKV